MDNFSNILEGFTCNRVPRNSAIKQAQAQGKAYIRVATLASGRKVVKITLPNGKRVQRPATAGNISNAQLLEKRGLAVLASNFMQEAQA